MLHKVALECTIRKVEENQEGLKWSETHYYLACVDHVNLVNKMISAITMNTNAAYK